MYSQVFFFYKLIYLVWCMNVLPACTRTYHVHAWFPWKSEEGPLEQGCACAWWGGMSAWRFSQRWSTQCGHSRAVSKESRVEVFGERNHGIGMGRGWKDRKLSLLLPSWGRTPRAAAGQGYTLAGDSSRCLWENPWAECRSVGPFSMTHWSPEKRHIPFQL